MFFLTSLAGGRHLVTGAGSHVISLLPIDFRAVPDAHDPNSLRTIVYLIDDPVIPDANSPIALGALYLPTSLGPWLLCQCSYCAYDAVKFSGGHPLQIPFGPPLDVYFMHEANAPEGTLQAA
jgi:hypothetical protein